MGKIKKNKIAGRGDSDTTARPIGLASQILRDESVRQPSRHKDKLPLSGPDVLEKYLPEDLSGKILKVAREQMEELQDELGPSTSDPVVTKSDFQSLQSKMKQADGSEDGADDNDDIDEEVGDFDDNEVQNLDPQEEELFNKFLAPGATQRRTLADIIAEKISEKQTELASKMSVNELDPALVEMYRGVRDVLSKYRSGKVPKAFKIIPKLTNWEQVLYITEPDKWSAAAMFQATRIFCSNMNPKMCQRFYNLILLPRIRDDITEYKKLNFHLYQALRKSLYKPSAFFKGILLPLCESGTCTLREATIIGSVIAKCSVPMLHTAAAMLKIAEMDYSGVNSLFLRVLIDKKYTLPYRVVDGLVNHFVRFTSDKRELPVLWHQALLALAQRYKNDMSADQKEALMELLRHQAHPKLTPEIRRELTHTESRDSEQPMIVPMESDNPEAFGM